METCPLPKNVENDGLSYIFKLVLFLNYLPKVALEFTFFKTVCRSVLDYFSSLKKLRFQYSINLKVLYIDGVLMLLKN